MTTPDSLLPIELPAHHDGSALYVSTQRPQLGQDVTVRIRVPSDSGVTAVRLRSVRDAEPFVVLTRPDGSGDGEDWFAAEITMHNPVVRYRFQLDRGTAGFSWVNAAGEHHRDVSDAADFWLTVHDPGPDWAVDAVVYQIFPDRFATSDAHPELPHWALDTGWDDAVIWDGPETPRQVYGGDLDGIRERLSYLQQLGIDTVYLTPIFPARSVHRYNATSFGEVDPLLGGDAALSRLAGAVHAAGMRLVGDLTTNHSGDDHEWFLAALADPAAPERGFYYFDATGTYVSWLGHATLPKLDLESAELRQRMFGTQDSVLTRWLREPYHLDGWRIDVANMTGRFGAHDHGHSIATMIRATLAEVAPEAVLIAEYTNDFSADLIGDGWQGSMNYAGFRNPVMSWLLSQELENAQLGLFYRMTRRPGGAAVATMREMLAGVPWKVATRHWNLTGSHDVARVRTVTGSAVLTQVSAVLLFTYVGVPMMFAGDEIGLEGVTGEDARRPMPWHRPDSWDTGTFAAYRHLIALRHAHPALRHGGLRWVLCTDDAIGYLRETAEERILVVVSRRPWTGAVLPATLAPAGTVQVLYGDAEPTVTDQGITLTGAGPAAHIWRFPLAERRETHRADQS